MGSYNRLPSRGASCKPVQFSDCTGLKIYQKKKVFLTFFISRIYKKKEGGK